MLRRTALVACLVWLTLSLCICAQNAPGDFTSAEYNLVRTAKAAVVRTGTPMRMVINSRSSFNQGNITVTRNHLLMYPSRRIAANSTGIFFRCMTREDTGNYTVHIEFSDGSVRKFDPLPVFGVGANRALLKILTDVSTQTVSGKPFQSQPQVQCADDSQGYVDVVLVKVPGVVFRPQVYYVDYTREAGLRGQFSGLTVSGERGNYQFAYVDSDTCDVQKSRPFAVEVNTGNVPEAAGINFSLVLASLAAFMVVRYLISPDKDAYRVLSQPVEFLRLVFVAKDKELCREAPQALPLMHTQRTLLLFTATMSLPPIILLYMYLSGINTENNPDLAGVTVINLEPGAPEYMWVGIVAMTELLLALACAWRIYNLHYVRYPVQTHLNTVLRLVNVPRSLDEQQVRDKLDTLYPDKIKRVCLLNSNDERAQLRKQWLYEPDATRRMEILDAIDRIDGEPPKPVGTCFLFMRDAEAANEVLQHNSGISVRMNPLTEVLRPNSNILVHLRVRCHRSNRAWAVYWENRSRPNTAWGWIRNVLVMLAGVFIPAAAAGGAVWLNGQVLAGKSAQIINPGLSDFSGVLLNTMLPTVALSVINAVTPAVVRWSVTARWVSITDYTSLKRLTVRRMYLAKVINTLVLPIVSYGVAVSSLEDKLSCHKAVSRQCIAVDGLSLLFRIITAFYINLMISTAMTTMVVTLVVVPLSRVLKRRWNAWRYPGAPISLMDSAGEGQSLLHGQKKQLRDERRVLVAEDEDDPEVLQFVEDMHVEGEMRATANKKVTLQDGQQVELQVPTIDAVARMSQVNLIVAVSMALSTSIPMVMPCGCLALATIYLSDRISLSQGARCERSDALIGVDASTAVLFAVMMLAAMQFAVVALREGTPVGLGLTILCGMLATVCWILLHRRLRKKTRQLRDHPEADAAISQAWMDEVGADHDASFASTRL